MPIRLLISIACVVGISSSPTFVFAGFFDSRAQRAERLAGYQGQYHELSAAFAKDIQSWADAAEQNGFFEEAARLRVLASPFDPGKIRVDRLPRGKQPKLPVSLPANEGWRIKVRKVREDYADDLYLLSRRMLHAGFPSAAYRLVREVVRANPDHRYARKILGYQSYGDEWITPFEAEQARKKMVWDEKFGWLPASDVERYRNGERRFRGWISKEQEEEIRRDFKNAWEVRTEHFLIKTNHSLEGGVDVAKKLEAYYDFLTEMFPAFFYSPDQLRKLFASSSSSRRRSSTEPFVVHYYREREEYNRALIDSIPQVAITNGLYHNGHRVAYFYHDPKGNNDSAIYHEATHQLFYETRFSRRNQQDVAADANFWIVEGIACYLESLQIEDGDISLGDPLYDRFYWARNRYLSENYYVPLGRFASMGMKQFQHQPREELSRNYSQAAGLAHFFMHAEDGAYREALVEHLSQIYQPNRRIGTAATLAELTGLSFAELDQKYGEYLRKQQKAVEDRQPLRPTANSNR